MKIRRDEAVRLILAGKKDGVLAEGNRQVLRPRRHAPVQAGVAGALWHELPVAVSGPTRSLPARTRGASQSWTERGEACARAKLAGDEADHVKSRRKAQNAGASGMISKSRSVCSDDGESLRYGARS